MHDPMGLVTDYALAVVAWVLAFRLSRAAAPWSTALFFTGIGAFVAGTYHGIYEHPMTWKAVLYSVGVASFFYLVEISGPKMRALATAKLFAYLIWMWGHDDFLWVIVDYGSTMLIIAAMHLIRRAPAAKWVLASIGVSMAGALVQQMRVTAHPFWFDHNDLYHVIQMVAVWLLYRAALVTIPAKGRPTTRPT